jgi:hypothetical protein
MHEDRQRRVLVPLRSNAKALLAGGPVAALRRRVKVLSLLFDEVTLEHGSLEITAGAEGTVVDRVGPTGHERWQSARERGFAEAGGIEIRIDVPGVDSSTAAALQPFFTTKTAIHWKPTLEPLIRELPTSADWFRGATFEQELPDDLVNQRKAWSQLDLAGSVLRRHVPDELVRSLIAEQLNHDLVLAAAVGMAVSPDAFHHEVLAARFEDDETWGLHGFALPLLFPSVGDLDWNEIRKLRKHRALDYFRKTLRDVEDEALEEAEQGGDIERSVHHTYEAALSKAQGRIESLPHVALMAGGSFVAGAAVDIATAGLTFPIGTIVGSAAGPSAGVVKSVAKAWRRRRSWAALDVRLRQP